MRVRECNKQTVPQAVQKNHEGKKCSGKMFLKIQRDLASALMGGGRERDTHTTPLLPGISLFILFHIETDMVNDISPLKYFPLLAFYFVIHAPWGEIVYIFLCQIASAATNGNETITHLS